MAIMENLGKIRVINKVKIRMKRRKISTRLFQIVIVTVVMTLFVYLIFTAGLQRASPPTDTFSWLSTRNLSAFLRPEEETRLAAPQPSPCQEGVKSAPMRLLVAVFSAPANTAARAVIRCILFGFCLSMHSLLNFTGKPGRTSSRTTLGWQLSLC